MEALASKQRHTLIVWSAALGLVVLSALFGVTPLKAYSVLGHEALIDAAWKPFIVPLLLSRYPGATAAELREAHAYAY